jgi:AraC-like DNA-binding protein
MPGSLVRRFTDPYEYQASVRASVPNVFLTAPGAFRAELTRIDLHRLWMQSGQASLPYVAHIVLTTDRIPIFFLADHQQQATHHSGLEVVPGDLVISRPYSENHQRAPAGSHWRSMSLSADDLAAAARIIIGRDLTQVIATRMMRPPPHLMSRLLQLHEAACRLATTVPDVLAQSEVARALEQELVGAMVHCIAHGMDVGIDEARRPRMPVMRRFEQVIADHHDKPLYVSEICAAIGVSERTLRLHCLEHLGISPHRYLWLRRMHQVRRALARADATAATVTAVASDHGFWELGRFSVAYRKLFGEPPSATLRGTPDRRRIAPASAIPTGALPILP